MQNEYGTCSLCLTESWRFSEMKHLNIYIHGSEGIEVCPDCDIALTNHVSAIRSVAGRSKKAVFQNKVTVKEQQ